MLILLASAGAIALRRKRPYIFTGWFWYLIMLLPVIGLIQVGSQAHADRYTYLPQTGLYLLLAWAVTDVLERFKQRCSHRPMAGLPSAASDTTEDGPQGRGYSGYGLIQPALASRPASRIVAVSASVAIAAFAWQAHIQASYWRNAESLWRHALAVTSRNFMAHDGFGVSLLGQGRLDEAINQFQMALEVAPGFSAAETNLSIALTRKGRIDDAISQLRTLVKEHPDDAEAHYQLGSALLKKGDLQSATAAYEKALSLQIRYPAAHYNLGIALDRNGRIDEAIAHYQEAVREDPHYAEAYYVLGNDLLRKARIDDAIAAYKRALESRPTYPEPENNLGLALIQKGRPSEAVAHWQNALAIQPDFVNSLNNLAWILATFPETWIRNGRQALALAERANRLSGNKNPAVLRTLAAACAENGRFTEARVIAERGLQLANAQGNSALANIFEADIVHYRANAPVRTATHPENSPP
jgi:Tfp pilus assembly protein PilF